VLRLVEKVDWSSWELVFVSSHDGVRAVSKRFPSRKSAASQTEAHAAMEKEAAEAGLKAEGELKIQKEAVCRIRHAFQTIQREQNLRENREVFRHCRGQGGPPRRNRTPDNEPGARRALPLFRESTAATRERRISAKFRITR
jgi:hypothetical protein